MTCTAHSCCFEVQSADFEGCQKCVRAHEPTFGRGLFSWLLDFVVITWNRRNLFEISGKDSANAHARWHMLSPPPAHSPMQLHFVSICRLRKLTMTTRTTKWPGHIHGVTCTFVPLQPSLLFFLPLPPSHGILFFHSLFTFHSPLYPGSYEFWEALVRASVLMFRDDTRKLPIADVSLFSRTCRWYFSCGCVLYMGLMVMRVHYIRWTSQLITSFLCATWSDSAPGNNARLICGFVFNGQSAMHAHPYLHRRWKGSFAKCWFRTSLSPTIWLVPGRVSLVQQMGVEWCAHERAV